MSEDLDFDVIKLKSTDGSPFVKIIDHKTGEVIDVTRQKYREMFSKSFDDLEKILDALIKKNASFVKR